MSARVFRKWCVFILITTGILWAAGAALGYLAIRFDLIAPVTGQTMLLAKAVLLVFALLAVYHFDIEQAGKTGFFAFVLAMIGTILAVIPEYLLLSVARGSGNAATELGNITALRNAGALIYIFGYLWFGITISFSGSLSRWGALAFTLGIILGTIPALLHGLPDYTALVGAIFGGTGLVWLAVSLSRVTEKGTADETG